MKQTDPLLVDRLLEQGEAGEEGAAAALYRLFPSFKWFVPTRPHQELHNQAEYPGDLFGFLALKREEEVIVPIFSSAEYAKSWAGREVTLRVTSGEHLLNTVPDGWWMCINPGQEVEKELSPWELNLIARGEEAIEELISELFAYRPVQQVETSPVLESENKELLDVLRVASAEILEIIEVYALKHVGETLRETSSYELLVGILCEEVTPDRLEAIRSNIANRCAIAQIGGYDVRVYIGCYGRESVALNLFMGEEPVYKREDSDSYR